MKIYILNLKKNLDKCYEKIILANCETEARMMANRGYEQFGMIWENESLTSCVELDMNDPVILKG